MSDVERLLMGFLQEFIKVARSKECAECVNKGKSKVFCARTFLDRNVDKRESSLSGTYHLHSRNLSCQKVRDESGY